MKINEFIVNMVACDWLTLSSYDTRDMRRMKYVMRDVGDVVRVNSKWMQYYGIEYIGGFVGQGEQRNLVHTVCRTSGIYADKIAEKMIKSTTSKVRCTRIDLQLTIPLPRGYSARVLSDYMKDNCRRKVGLIENGGLDTVYIGSRKSAKFWRIYVKEDSKRNLWLRAEIEVKRDRDRITDMLVGQTRKFGREALVSYFWNEFHKLRLPEPLASQFGRFEAPGTVPLPHTVRDEGERVFEWLDNTVRKSIVKFAMASDGRAGFVLKWLNGIQDEITAAMRNDGLDSEGDKGE